MLKRGLLLLVLIALLSLTVGAASAQAPFVSITSPASGTTVNLAAILPVTVSFGNAPEGGATLMVRAWNGTQSVLYAQDQTIDTSLIPWTASIDLSSTPPSPGTPGVLIAYMLDSGGTVIATSPGINVTYGTAPAPTATPTATTPPLPTATATSPGPNPSITVLTPVSGSTVDPSTNIPVTGTVANVPTGATILVRLRNANGQTLGEQGIVPAGANWNLTITQSVPGVPTMGNGDMFAFLILNGTVVAQTNAIPLNFVGAPPTTAITITSPANGAVLNRNSPNAIAGTVTSLPGGATVLVQAFVNGSSNPVGQQTGTLNGANWSASLSLSQSVSPGTAGTLRAFAMSGNTVLASSNVVNVVYGQQTGSPFVQITVPSQNAVVAVGGAGIQMFGLAGNLPQNSIVVRALDSFSNVLAQTTVGTDPAGNWSAFLTVNVAPGTPGTLYAFVTNPNTNNIVASSRINVFYGGQCFVRTDWPIHVVQTGDTLLRIAQRVGSTVQELAIANCLPNANLVFVGQQLRVPRLPVTPPPTQATLRIIAPSQNATIDTSERVTVTGAGRAIAGNDVIVRILDANGNQLAQQTTRVGAAGTNGESQWQVSLSVLAQNGTRGSIYAFAQVPGTSTVLADALIDISFSSEVIVVPTPPPGSEQRLFITQPSSDSSVTPSGEVQVTGVVMGEYEGTLLVIAYDGNGEQIAHAEATVSPAQNNQANWQATLNINIQPGTRGTIYAYVSAPFENERSLADAVNVLFGQDNGGPYVTITDPMPHSIIANTNPLLISGRGGRLFEGNVVVQALDETGNVLAESATIINSPDAGTGGEGDWQLSLPINVPIGTRGIITAFSTSAQDGSIVASASVPVTYGDPISQANFVRINTPLNNALVDPSQTVMIAGTADDSSATSVTIQIVDSQGNVLVEQPRNLNPSVDGEFGVWQMLVELSSMSPGTQLRFNALLDAGGATSSDSVVITVGVPSS